MKLKGKYRHEIIKFVDCELLIENGLIHKTTVNLPPIYSFSYQPKDKSDFKLEKLPSVRSLVPMNANYLIEYVGTSDSIQTMYFNLSFSQVFKLKWQLREWLVQDKSFALEILKYAGVAFLGSIFTLMFQYCNNEQSDGLMETPSTQEVNNVFEGSEDEIKIDTSLIDKENVDSLKVLD